MVEPTSKAARMTVSHPGIMQLYSARTSNGIKAAMALEEIVTLRATTEDFNYEAHTVDIRHAENRKADFTEAINPNAKIPALVDPHGIDGRPVTVWESGAILLYLAEKYNELMPRDDPVRRAEMMSWLFWGSTGFSSQVKLFGFYFKHTTQMDYCVERYAKECHRLLGVLNKQLTKHGKQYVIGDEYTIADIAIWPWVNAIVTVYDPAFQMIFDNFKEYPAVHQWYRRVLERPTTQRALLATPFVH